MNLFIIIFKKKIFIISIFPLILIEIYRYHKLKQIKVCICTIGKQENRYIKEYIEYYKNYGIDKIFLYDKMKILKIY